MGTEQRKTTHLRRYMKNVYWAQKSNNFQKVYQKCVLNTETQQYQDGRSELCTDNRRNKLESVHQKSVLRTETQRFIDGTSEMWTEHRNKTISNGISEKCTVQRNTTISRRYIRNVYWALKNNFQTVHHKCLLSTETQQFPDGTSEMCTEHRNTISRRYITNVYWAPKHNNFQTVIRNVYWA